VYFPKYERIIYKEELFYHLFCLILKKRLTLIKEPTLQVSRNDKFRATVGYFGGKINGKGENVT
jgi:hypothetical protein